jgi:mannose-6-phosphate isomerase-like protein (cupin superfamily)
MMKITRVYSDPNGESRFEDVEIELHEKGEIGALSEPTASNEVIFREVNPDYDYDFHTAPQRQFIILLDGEIEIETSLGEKRKFGAGEILLMEDTAGKGHKTRNLQPIRRKSVFITLPSSAI